MPVLSLSPEFYSAKGLVERVGRTVSTDKLEDFVESLLFITENYKDLKREVFQVYTDYFSPQAFARTLSTWAHKNCVDLQSSFMARHKSKYISNVQELNYLKCGLRLSTKLAKICRRFNLSNVARFSMRLLNRIVRLVISVVFGLREFTTLIRLEIFSIFTRIRHFN